MDTTKSINAYPQFINIPQFIIMDKEIAWPQKVLYAYIYGFATSTGRAFPNNKSLSVILNFELRHIQKMLSELEEKGYIRRIQGEKRLIQALKHPVMDFIIEQKTEQNEKDTPCTTVHPPMHHSAPPPCTTVHTYNKAYKKEDKSSSSSSNKQIDLAREEVSKSTAATFSSELLKAKTVQEQVMLDEHCRKLFVEKRLDKKRSIMQEFERCVEWRKNKGRETTLLDFKKWLEDAIPEKTMTVEQVVKFFEDNKSISPSADGKSLGLSQDEEKILREYRIAIESPQFMKIYFRNELRLEEAKKIEKRVKAILLAKQQAKFNDL